MRCKTALHNQHNHSRRRLSKMNQIRFGRAATPNQITLGEITSAGQRSFLLVPIPLKLLLGSVVLGGLHQPNGLLFAESEYALAVPITFAV